MIEDMRLALLIRMIMSSDALLLTEMYTTPQEKDPHYLGRRSQIVIFLNSSVELKRLRLVN